MHEVINIHSAIYYTLYIDTANFYIPNLNCQIFPINPLQPFQPAHNLISAALTSWYRSG